MAAVNNRYSSRERMALIFFALAVGIGVTCGIEFSPGDDWNPWNGHWLIWYFIFSQLFLPLAVCLHELGHAWMALLVGGEVHYIRLGFNDGETIPRRFRFLGFDWLLYSFPQSGAVYSSFYTSELYRLRRCLMIAGGPLINLLLGLSALPFLQWDHVTLLHLICMGWLIGNATLFFLSVVPLVIRYRGEDHPNDAMLFWRTLAFTDPQITDYVTQAERARGFVTEYAFARAMPTSELIEQQMRNSTNPVFLYYAVLKMHEENDPRFDEYAVRLIEHSVVTKAAKFYVVDLYLTKRLHDGPPPDLNLADRLSRELVEHDNQTTIRGTRGSVLVDIGRVEEGKAMLQDVLRETKSPTDQVYSNVFLALAEKQQGDLAKARAHAEAAKKIDPNSPVLKRVEDLLIN